MTRYRAFKIRMRWNSQGKMQFVALMLLSQKTGQYKELGEFATFEGAMARIYSHRIQKFARAIA